MDMGNYILGSGRFAKKLIRTRFVVVIGKVMAFLVEFLSHYHLHHISSSSPPKELVSAFLMGISCDVSGQFCT